MTENIKWVTLYGTLKEVLTRRHRWLKLVKDGEVVITELTEDQEYSAREMQKNRIIKQAARSTLFRIELFGPPQPFVKMDDISK